MISIRKLIPSFNVERLYICFVWLIGFTVGAFIVSPLLYKPVDCSVLWNRNSVIGMLSIQLFPLLVYWFLIRFKKRCWILPVLFLKSLALGATMVLMKHLYGDAGWLVCTFVFSFAFSGEFVSMVFLLRNQTVAPKTLYADYIIASSIIFVLGIINYYLIYPFWVKFIY